MDFVYSMHREKLLNVTLFYLMHLSDKIFPDAKSNSERIFVIQIYSFGTSLREEDEW